MLVSSSCRLKHQLIAGFADDLDICHTVESWYYRSYMVLIPRMRYYFIKRGYSLLDRLYWHTQQSSLRVLHKQLHLVSIFTDSMAKCSW